MKKVLVLLLAILLTTANCQDSEPVPEDSEWPTPTKTNESSPEASEKNTATDYLALGLHFLDTVLIILIGVKEGAFGGPPAFCEGPAGKVLDITKEISNKMNKEVDELRKLNTDLKDVLKALSTPEKIKEIIAVVASKTADKEVTINIPAPGKKM